MTESNPFYVIMKDGRACGYVRFENADPDDSGVSPGDLAVSMVLAPDARGQGIGGAALREACGSVLKSGRAPRVHAIVKLDNQASLAMVRGCHFVENGVVLKSGQPAMCFYVEKKGKSR